MAIAARLAEYLQRHDIGYDVVAHPHSRSSLETAQRAHVPGNRLAKTVVLEDDEGFLLAVLPASHRLDLGELHRQLNRSLGLATEQELELVFEDCEVGAIPPAGAAYGLEAVVDDSLAEQPDVYVEAGDHERLLHLSAESFAALVEGAQHRHFSRHM
ncbi:MAG: YbaK/EbsC family protein [Gammaproteobacteria bacterium]